MSKIRWLPRARDDLKQIRAFIARDSKMNARRWIAEIRRTAESLRLFPEAGSLVNEFPSAGLRETFLGSYRIIYRIRGNEAQILRVIHGARRLPGRLEELEDGSA